MSLDIKLSNLEEIYGTNSDKACSPLTFRALFQNSLTIGFRHFSKRPLRYSSLVKTLVISSKVACSLGSSIARKALFLKYCSNIGPPTVFMSKSLLKIFINSLITKVFCSGYLGSYSSKFKPIGLAV